MDAAHVSWSAISLKYCYNTMQFIDLGPSQFTNLIVARASKYRFVARVYHKSAKLFHMAHMPTPFGIHITYCYPCILKVIINSLDPLRAKNTFIR